MTIDTNIESIARDALAQVLESSTVPSHISLETDMAEGLGLTSLNKVIFLMSVCDETGVSVSAFTEADVAEMRTLRNVIEAFARSRG